MCVIGDVLDKNSQVAELVDANVGKIEYKADMFTHTGSYPVLTTNNISYSCL